MYLRFLPLKNLSSGTNVFKLPVQGFPGVYFLVLKHNLPPKIISISLPCSILQYFLLLHALPLFPPLLLIFYRYTYFLFYLHFSPLFLSFLNLFPFLFFMFLPCQSGRYFQPARDLDLFVGYLSPDSTVLKGGLPPVQRCLDFLA
jgi:hypothetical protein